MATGTTRHLRDVFIGRCWQYQANQMKNQKKVLNINCRELWNAFTVEFAHRDPCSSNSSLKYSKFFSLLQADANTTLPNAMFYSGSKNLVDDFTFINDDYVVLEETLTGYLLDNLVWCGSATSPDGLNYTLCPKWGDPCDIRYTFWKYASRIFARRAYGTAHTLLNASRSKGTAYHKTGFFRTYEMPELKVDHLVVFVASNVVNPSSEKCGTGSLLELQEDADKRNITVKCIDQPELVLRRFCLKFPRSSHCKKKSNEDKLRKWRIVGITTSVISVILLIVIAVLIVRPRVSRKGDNYNRQHERVQNNNLNYVIDSTGSLSGGQSNGILLA